jgi:DHA2 family multidrug resistance protein
LEQGERESWYESKLIIGFTISAFFGVLAFIWRELTASNPIVDLRILLKGNVGIGTILNFILGFGLFASVFVYPVFVQRFLGFTATQTGLSLLPGALISGFMMPIMGAMLAKGVKPKYLISIGFFLFFVFTVFTSTKLIATAGEDDFFWPLILRGLSLSMLFVPLASLSFGGLVGRDIASAAGITSMMRQLGGSFSVALVSVFSERWFAQHRVDLISNVNAYSPSTMERMQAYINGLVGRSGSIEKATQQAYAVMENVVSKQAQILTYIDIFFYLGIFFLLCIPLVFFARSFKAKVDTSSAH